MLACFSYCYLFLEFFIQVICHWNSLSNSFSYVLKYFIHILLAVLLASYLLLEFSYPIVCHMFWNISYTFYLLGNLSTLKYCQCFRNFYMHIRFQFWHIMIFTVNFTILSHILYKNIYWQWQGALICKMTFIFESCLSNLLLCNWSAFQLTLIVYVIFYTFKLIYALCKEA